MTTPTPEEVVAARNVIDAAAKAEKDAADAAKSTEIAIARQAIKDLTPAEWQEAKKFTTSRGRPPTMDELKDIKSRVAARRR